MDIPYYHVDAFSSERFKGNPAAVCVLPYWIELAQLQHMAAEHQLPVTAFIVAQGADYAIRWLTPEKELPLCGHGSLAAAWVIFSVLQPDRQHLNLLSPHAGVVPVQRQGNGFELTFPAQLPTCCEAPAGLIQALGVEPHATYQYQTERLLVVLDHEHQVRLCQPDIALLKQLTHRAIVLTAPGVEVDFVSRTFYPDKAIAEDAVTGASHCVLTPYWVARLHKKLLQACQVSARRGWLMVQYQEPHVLITAHAVLYQHGVITV